MPRWQKRSLRTRLRAGPTVSSEPTLARPPATPPHRAHTGEHCSSLAALAPQVLLPVSAGLGRPGEPPVASPFPMRPHLKLSPRRLSQMEEGQHDPSHLPGDQASCGSGSRPCTGTSAQTSGSPAAQDVRDREWAGSLPIPVNSVKSRLLRPDMDGVHGGWACLCVSVFHDQGHYNSSFVVPLTVNH